MSRLDKRLDEMYSQTIIIVCGICQINILFYEHSFPLVEMYC